MVLGILVVPQRPRNCERVGDGDSAVWALLIADRYLCIVAVLLIGKTDETCVYMFCRQIRAQVGVAVETC